MATSENQEMFERIANETAKDMPVTHDLVTALLAKMDGDGMLALDDLGTQLLVAVMRLEGRISDVRGELAAG